MDMAVGIIIAFAFGTVVKSMVDDIIMPPIGVVTGRVDFKSLHYELKPAEMDRKIQQGLKPLKSGHVQFINM